MAEEVTTLQRCEKTLITIAKLSPLILAAAVVIYIIYYFIKGIYFMIEHKKRINNNWPTYRCKPYVMPFAGWFVGPGSTNPASNFIECSFSMHKSFYDVLKQDFVTMFGSLADIVKDQQSAIQDARKMTNFMRNSIKHFAQDIYQKVYDAYYRISSLFGVFLGAFGNLFQLFSDSYHTLLYAYYTLESVWNGPIGITTRALEDLVRPIEDVIRFFCFSPDTPILMADGTYTRASDIKLGQQLGMNAGTVTTCMEINGKDAEMYLYRDCVTVSGSHLVNSLGEGWVRIEDSIHAQPTKWDGRNIFCFNTTNNRIPAASYLFADYMETNDDATITRIQASTLHQLNTNKTISLHSLQNVVVRPQYTWAFHGDTKVDLIKGGYKAICDLKIGDNLALGGTVQAVIKVSPVVNDLYSYRGDMMTGTQIVLEDGKWIEVRDVGLAVKETCTKKLYHVTTNNGVMRLHSGVTTTDFLQSTCEEQSDLIDQYVKDIHYGSLL